LVREELKATDWRVLPILGDLRCDQDARIWHKIGLGGFY